MNKRLLDVDEMNALAELDLKQLNEERRRLGIKETATWLGEQDVWRVAEAQDAKTLREVGERLWWFLEQRASIMAGDVFSKRMRWVIDAGAESPFADFVIALKQGRMPE